MKLPVIIMLALMPLVLTAYAEAPSHVDVYDYPFNITLLEGGNFTLYNNGTNTISFSGSFPGTVEVDSQETFELPVYYFNAPNTYYLRDMSLPDTYMSTVTLVKPTPVYVSPTPSFTSTSNETLGSFESISNSTFVEPTAPTPEPTQPQNNSTDVITSSSVSIPTRESDYYNKDTLIYVNGRILNSTGFDITPFVEPVDKVEEVNSIPESSDTEVLNLRLQILKVIESIFKIVLQ